MKKLLWLSFLTFLLSSNSYAINLNGLNGVKEFRFKVNFLAGDGGACGVTEKKIKNSIKYVLSSTRVKLNENSKTVLYANASIFGVKDYGCFGRYALEVFEWDVRENSSGYVFYSPIILYSESAEVKNEKLLFTKYFLDTIEDATKAFVVAWSEKNN